MPHLRLARVLQVSLRSGLRSACSPMTAFRNETSRGWDADCEMCSPACAPAEGGSSHTQLTNPACREATNGQEAAGLPKHNLLGRKGAKRRQASAY